MEVDTKALIHNARVFHKIVGQEVALMAVVKSNAYGHGILEVAKVLASKVEWFGVDDIDEALLLRREGVSLPILVLGYTLPVRYTEASKHNISITISSLDSLRHCLQITNCSLHIHLKLETGLNRQGITLEELEAGCQILEKLKGKVVLEGVYSHFAVAELAGQKKPARLNSRSSGYRDYCNKQMDRFEKMYESLVSRLVPSTYQSRFDLSNRGSSISQAKSGLQPIRHMAGTAATVLLPRSHYNMVRVGIGLYGLDPTSDPSRPLISGARSRGESSSWEVSPLRPALGWYSVIAQVKSVKRGERVGYDLTEKLVRDSKLAIVPVGYWHGYPRSLSHSDSKGRPWSGGVVLVRGKPCKIIGKISMDMMTVDVTDVKGVKQGDQVVLIGRSGKTYLSAEEVAHKAGTINYELVTRINPGLKRFYK